MTVKAICCNNFGMARIKSRPTNVSWDDHIQTTTTVGKDPLPS